MSRLFLATEASLHRQVVIKLLPPEFASEQAANDPARTTRHPAPAPGRQQGHGSSVRDL
jgi:hypothetical protein